MCVLFVVGTGRWTRTGWLKSNQVIPDDPNALGSREELVNSIASIASHVA